MIKLKQEHAHDRPGTGIVALSLESVGVALVFFGIAGWLIKLA
jgi:hypothetical protein